MLTCVTFHIEACCLQPDHNLDLHALAPCWSDSLLIHVIEKKNLNKRHSRQLVVRILGLQWRARAIIVQPCRQDAHIYYTHSALGLCIVWMIRYDTYRDTFDPIHDTYRRYVSDQIYDVTRHIFDKLVCTMLFITSALLRLECTIDCMSGSVGHHQNVFPFIFWLCLHIHTFRKKIKIN